MHEIQRETSKSLEECRDWFGELFRNGTNQKFERLYRRSTTRILSFNAAYLLSISDIFVKFCQFRRIY